MYTVNLLSFPRPTDILKGKLREAFSLREEQTISQLEVGLRALEEDSNQKGAGIKTLERLERENQQKPSLHHEDTAKHSIARNMDFVTEAGLHPLENTDLQSSDRADLQSLNKADLQPMEKYDLKPMDRADLQPLDKPVINEEKEKHVRLEPGLQVLEGPNTNRNKKEEAEDIPQHQEAGLKILARLELNSLKETEILGENSSATFSPRLKGKT